MNLTDGLTALVADEPPYVLDPDAVVRSGRRRRRARQSAAGGAMALTVGVIASAVVLTTSSAPDDRLILGAAPMASSTPAETGDGSVYYKVVRSLTPSNWTIEDIDSRAWQANVDDGHGAGRLYIGVSPHPGSLQQHPCRDPEFTNGSTCVETMLDADTRLIVRGLSHDNPVRSLEVVIVHADGGGVNVSANNATLPEGPPSGTRVTPEQKRLLWESSVNRPEPVYSADQLVEIAKAIDAAIG